MATVKELIEFLSQYPPDMRVIIESTNPDEVITTYFHLHAEGQIIKVSDDHGEMWNYEAGDEEKLYEVRNFDGSLTTRKRWRDGCFEALEIW